MNRGVLQSSPVQQIMMAGNPNNWWNMRSPSSPSSNFLTHPPYAPPSWHENQDQLPAESWSHLLILPYLGSGSGNMRHQQSVQGEKNSIFPEDPGQLLNENSLKRKAASEQDCEEEEKKDLRSRGLCLVPVSCTLQVGSDNGADYWAPAFGGAFQ